MENAVADRNLGGFYRAVLGVLQGLGDIARATEFEALVQQRYEPWQIVRRLGDLNHDSHLATMRKRLAMVILQSMNAEAARLEARQFREYATVNPETVAFLERYAADLVVGLEADVRVAVEQVLIQGARNGTDVRVQARQIAQVIGLSRGQALSVVNVSAAAYSDALADGATVARAQALADRAGERASARLIKYRAETIARTETIRAQNAGQQAVWRDYQNRGLLPKVARKVWIVTPDDRLDKIICAPMDGREAFVEDDFETPAGPFPYPPAHPRCRCAMGIASL